MTSLVPNAASSSKAAAFSAVSSGDFRAFSSRACLAWGDSGVASADGAVWPSAEWAEQKHQAGHDAGDEYTWQVMHNGVSSDRWFGEWADVRAVGGQTCHG